MKPQRLLLALLAVLLATLPAQAQEEASVNWALTEAEGTAVTSTTGVATGIAVRSSELEVRSYSGTLQDDSEGPLGPFQRWWLGGNEWPVESTPDPDRYIEFVVTPQAGATLTITDILLILNAGGTGEMQANLFYDTDPAFAAPMLLEGDISVSREAVGNFSYMIDATLAEGDSLYFRVYPWLGGGNASTGRYLFLQDVTISGTGTMGDPPAAEGVYWSLTEADTTSVTSASDNLGGAPVRGTGIMIRNYADDSDPGPGPLGAIQRWWLDANWPDEMEPNPERYIEFAAAADAGYAFDADSISLYLGSHGTGNMMASLYYSTDPAFSDSVVLEEHLDVPRTEFGYFVYELDVAVEEGDSLYFRVYPYLEGGSTSAGKYVLLQAVTLAGSVVAPPPAVEGVYWSLTEADTTSVTATGDNLGGAPVRSAGIMIRNYADGSDPGPGPL
ncbi:MAG TPA: hypothetical protein VKP65_16870 [Rhodothermales bacterium]|nr:hypothetical protein [Rhodothermales bacterium]